MKSDILNNECTDRSPCLTCERKNMDKNQCIDTCEALATYRAGQPWEGKETVKIMEETEVKDQKPICEMPDCSESAVIRGLCQEDYDRWRNGMIEHPRLGMFKRTNVSAKKGTCLIEDCDEIATLRGLCSPHYQSWRKGYIEHPKFGSFTVSQAQSKIKAPEIKKTNPEPQKKNFVSRSYPYPDIIPLDFTNYPEIKRVIFERADELLPPEHLIFSLLAKAIAGKEL